MAISPNDLRRVISDSLKVVPGWYSRSAVNLLMMTSAAETHCGENLFQIGGPALGIYQMEPATHNDIVSHMGDRYQWMVPDPERLAYDLRYATLMARADYWRFPEPLPDADDIVPLALLYKKRWNTGAGKARVDLAVECYLRYGGS